MSDPSSDTTTTVPTKPESLIARLKTPMTLTLPTWAYAATGFAVLLLVIVALD